MVGESRQRLHGWAREPTRKSPFLEAAWVGVIAVVYTLSPLSVAHASTSRTLIATVQRVSDGDTITAECGTLPRMTSYREGAKKDG